MVYGGGGQVPHTFVFNARYRVAILLLLLVITIYIFVPQLPSPSSSTALLDDSIDSTAECTESFDGRKPVWQYVLMVDAGSTGSRIHVYKFHNCAETPTLAAEELVMIKPGLSSYADQPEIAAASLDSLLDAALLHVPKEAWSCTPIAVKATAGLRLLGPQKAQAILSHVEKRLRHKYPFHLPKEGGVVIMDGRDEGVYAWITVNYLLGRIGNASSTQHSTVGVFDLGGASTQIVFQPRFDVGSLKKGDFKYELDYNGASYELYQHSHLGFGLMEARKKMYGLMTRIGDVLHNPCLPKGIQMGGSSSSDVPMRGTGTLGECKRLAEEILNKTADCTVVPCSFNGVHQPALRDTFKGQVYIFSYFYDRTAPLGMPHQFSLSDLAILTNKVCSGDFTGFSEDAVRELNGNKHLCMDLSFILALLSSGYEMAPDRQLYIANKIGDKELGWCLGASLPLLDNTLECKLLA